MKPATYAEAMAPLIRALREMLKRAKDPVPLLAFIGHYMVFNKDGTKSEFDTKGHGTWKPLRLRRGDPLRDVRTLERGIAYKVLGKDNVAIGTNVMHGHTHQQDGNPKSTMTIVPKKAKALVFIGPDPGGPQKRGASTRRVGKVGEKGLPTGLRWYFLKKVVIPARPFLVWRRWQMAEFTKKAGEWITTGEIPRFPNEGGNASGKIPERRKLA